MLDRWIVNLVLMFVLKEIDTFRDENEWAKLREDADALIRRLMPGTFFDPAAAAVVVSLIHGIEKVLAAPSELEDIARLLSAGDYQTAIESLKRLLISRWWPTGVADKRAAKALLA